ncbi:cell division protein FtsW [Candidatus Vecturithrix granuli]|uniref:Cell division protein FtsW n=1 Tax=Vecturithrix granuli TaxID=1499967 RepID=A0A081BZS6_VECG1|nr:cell division protein FtsW [Candidatus Vecturithrix granuli]
MIDEVFAYYPLHVLYLLAYAALLLLSAVMILWPISRKRSHWTSVVNFFIMIGGNCGLFALGYHALNGFIRDRETGIIVIALYLIAGLVFAKNVNSRNVTLLPLIFMLSTTGFLMLYRLSLSSARIVTTEFIKQIIFISLGLLLMLGLVGVLKLIFLLDVHGDRLELLGMSKTRVFLGRFINTLFVKPRFSYHIWLILTMILLAIPLIFGASMRVSLGAVQVQPSEFVKITFVIYLTHHLTRYRQKIGAWDEPISSRITFLIPPLLLLSLPFFGYVLQRDFGPLMLYSLLIISMFFVGTSRLLEVGILLLIFVSTIILYNQFFPYINALVPKYASIIIDRINIWQNPWLYTKGEQIVRSLWAIKAAGLWGTGLGMGHPEFFPSEVQHDFIFTLIAHELGLAGGVLVILSYVLFCWQGIRIAVATKYDVAWNEEWAWFRLRLALGCTLVLFFQAMINIGGVTNFSLMTGITLPYVSYGGTSLLVSYLLAGILAFCSLTKNEMR